MMLLIFEDKIASFIEQFLEKLPALHLCVLATLHKPRRAVDSCTRILDLLA
jgi:hypothetical protein